MNYIGDESDNNTDRDMPSMLNMVLSVGDQNDSVCNSTTSLEGIKFPSCTIYLDNVEVKS